MDDEQVIKMMNKKVKLIYEECMKKKEGVKLFTKISIAKAIEGDIDFIKFVLSILD